MTEGSQAEGRWNDNSASFVYGIMFSKSSFSFVKYVNGSSEFPKSIEKISSIWFNKGRT